MGVVVAGVLGWLATRTGEGGRLRVWRAAIVLSGAAVVGVIAGTVTGNVALFYGGALGAFVGLLLAVGLSPGVFRDREDALGRGLHRR